MTFTLNGILDPGEWSGATRLDYVPGASPVGYSLYGTIEGGAFVFSLQSATTINPNTTIWLNVDHDNTTGYQIFGNQTGADFNVNFIDDAGAVVPRLYTGASGEVLKDAITAYAFSADRQSVEFKVPLSLLGITTPAAVTDVYADVNDSVYLPGDYSQPGYKLIDPATLPQATDTSLKVGIVYSATSAAKFFDSTAYSNLFMAAQNQAAMAGVPYDLLTEADLKDLSKLINYDALIFPSFQNVNKADLAVIQSTLDTAVYKYGVGLITAGNFMTNDETGAALAGDAYARMKSLLGVGLQGSGSGEVVVKAGDVTHPVMNGYTAGEQIRDYASIGTQYFGDLTGGAKVLATQSINGGSAQNAVLATTTGGKNVHFATEGMLADNNMLEDAIDWAVHDASKPVLELQMSRQSAIFASRNDLDEAMQPAEVDPAGTTPGIYDKLLPILQQWKAAYNFVGSYYIDIGDGTGGTSTNWTVSAPYYKSLIAMGNEIGSHSITHPEDTNLLTDAQLQTEFQQSKLIIEQNFAAQGIKDPIDPTKPYLLAGAAIPGAPEKLAVSEKVMAYYDYLSGGNAQVGAGYPGAFGHMLPGDSKVYLAPNISSDFTLIGFKQMTPDQATAAWQEEWKDATAHASLPVVVFPWHDYGIAGYEPGYSVQMFESLIKTAFDAGSEFVTLNDLAQRVSAFDTSSLKYDMLDANTIKVTVGSGGSLGTFALDLSGQTIKSVAGMYAYDADSVFLPKSGGTFTINLGATPDDVTHITALPSRAELLAATSPGGGGLDFSVVGEGTLLVDLEALNGRSVSVAGAQIASLTADKLALNLTGFGQHDVSIRLQAVPPSEVVQTVAFSADSGASNNDFITNVATQTVTGTLSAALVAGDTVKISVDNGATWKMATAAVGGTTFSLSDVALTNSGTPLQAQVESAAGLASNALLQAYVLDQTPPSEAVSIVSMAKDSGVPGDFITNDGSADRAVTGTLSTALATDETLQVSFDNGSTWTSGSVTGTNWTATDNAVHSASWTIQARVVDLAGNTGPIVSQAVTYDTSSPGPFVSVFHNGTWSQETPTPYSGPVQDLQYQYLGTANGEVVIGTASNDFINLLGGDDAANGGSGNDVLDGGLGSNFLTGGAGSDVFFLDGRSGQTTWSTITDWETGEQLSLWGWRPGVSKATWVDTAGATGYEGVTLHGDLNGDGTIDASVTWTGLTQAHLPTPLEFDGLLWFT